MKLAEVFTKSMIILDLNARDKRSAIREMLQHLVDQKKLTEELARKAERGIQQRESEGSTGIGKGLAIPHAKDCTFLDKGVLGVFGRSREGIPFDSVDGGLVKIIFVVISSPDSADDHLKVMRKVARLHRDEKTLRFLAETAKPESVLEIFEEIDDGTP